MLSCVSVSCVSPEPAQPPPVQPTVLASEKIVNTEALRVPCGDTTRAELVAHLDSPLRIAEISFFEGNTLAHVHKMPEPPLPYSAVAKVAVFCTPPSERWANIRGADGATMLYLAGTVTLTPEFAAQLAQYNVGSIHMRVTELSPEAARILAHWRGNRLVLDGLTELSPEAAKALIPWRGSWLTLDSLTRLTPETAHVLGSWRGLLNKMESSGTSFGGGLGLNGVTHLSAPAAEGLARSVGSNLYLNGVTRLPAKTARALANWRGSELFLNGISQLSATEMDAIANWQQPRVKARYLHLSGLTHVSSPVARALARWKGSSVTLAGVSHLSPEAAQLLAGRDFQIFIGSPSRLVPKGWQK
ncbi:MAG: hypothetical protein JKY56_00430 [Kofleriaceae bacterium]|nr:hypothetical protein [Kofleriaceae bacterium]